MVEKRRKFFETKKFKDLQKIWYDKLKKDNFIDHEKLVNGRLFLAQTSTHPFRHCHSPLSVEARLAYYLFLTQRVATEDFKNERDRLILTWRSEGQKIVSIILNLKQHGFICHRQTVRYVIRRYENKWNLRRWQKSQMTSNLATG